MGRSNTTRRGPLPRPEVRADDPSLTRFAGVLPLARFCSEIGLGRALRGVAPAGRSRVHPRVHVLFAFVLGSVLGVGRLAHLEWCRGDALLLKVSRLASWPSRKVFSMALASVEDAGIEALDGVLAWLGFRGLQGASTLVIDFDSTALVSFGHQEGAVFGYNGKGRNRRRHHPLVASVAETRAVVHARYRDGSAIDAGETIEFLDETVRRAREHAPLAAVSLRADSGFWSARVGEWLLEQAIPFAFSLPMHPGVKLAALNARYAPVEHGDEDLEVALVPGSFLRLDPRLRVVVVRRAVHDPGAPPPGKCIESDPFHRYQAVVTSLDWAPLDAWRFYNDRGDAERPFKVGKHALGLGNLVSQDYRANEVAFLLRLVAYNTDLHFQAAAEATATAAGRPVERLGLAARQPRLYHLAGRLLRAGGRWLMRLPANRHVEDLWRAYDPGGFSTA